MLTEIANECGTDKGTVHRDRHGYTLVYELLLAPYRELPFDLLEIGLQIGPESDLNASRRVTDAPSVKMWHEYFPNAHIYGMDISDFTAYQTDWFTFFQVDCGNSEQLETVTSCGVTYDVIIDDGSHASYHQQLTLCKLFNNLKSGGTYFIEDLHWQPTIERQLPNVPLTISVLGNYLSQGKFTDTGAIPRSEWQTLENQIASIVFVDEDTLVDLRHFFNIKRGIPRSQEPNFFELPTDERMWSRGHLRHIKHHVRQTLRAIRGDVIPPRQSMTKLAIIRKV